MDSELLKYHAAKAGYSMAKLAAALGVNASTLSRKMRGETDFTRSEIVIIRKCLHLTLEEADAIFLRRNLRKMRDYRGKEVKKDAGKTKGVSRKRKS